MRVSQQESYAFEFGHFIPQLCTLLGNEGICCFVSTWTMNREHALELIRLLQDGIVKRMVVFTDPYFSSRESAVFATLLEGLQAHGQTLITFKNHCKILALSNSHGQCVTVFASANLSAQPRTENYTLTTSDAVYEWVTSSFFEQVMLQHG